MVRERQTGLVLCGQHAYSQKLARLRSRRHAIWWHVFTGGMYIKVGSLDRSVAQPTRRGNDAALVLPWTVSKLRVSIGHK
jgi:hypothetical protein